MPTINERISAAVASLEATAAAAATDASKLDTFIHSATGYTTDSGLYVPSLYELGSTMSSNLIINGDMEVSQQYGTAEQIIAVASNIAPVPALDCWRIMNAAANTLAFQQDTDAPVGYLNSLKIRVNSARTTLASTDRFTLLQRIEGRLSSCLGLGSSSPKNIAIKFWIKSSVVGRWIVGVRNPANNLRRTFAITINSANTWEQKVITPFAAANSGSWAVDNSIGIEFFVDLGSGSGANGVVGTDWSANAQQRDAASANFASTQDATLRITGVTLCEGSAANVPRIKYTQQMERCLRYYEVINPAKGCVFLTYTPNGDTRGSVTYKVSKRAVPTITCAASATAIAMGSTNDGVNISISGIAPAGATETSFGIGVSPISGYGTLLVWSAALVFTVDARL